MTMRLSRHDTEWLRAVLRLGLETPRAGDGAAVAGGPRNQSAIGAWCRTHRATAIVAAGMSAAGCSVPDEWNDVAAAGQFAQLQAAHELAEISAVLAAASVDHCCFKGLAVAQYFPQPALRRAGVDADILVTPSRARDAALALFDAGWQDRNSDEVRAQIFKRFYQLELQPAEGGELALDLHWNIDHAELPSSPSAAGIIERRQRAQLAGVGVPVPEPADHLHLCVIHAAKNGCARWWLLADIAMLLKEVDADSWQRVWACDPLRPALARCLVLAEHWCGAALTTAQRADVDPWRQRISKELAGLDRRLRRCRFAPDENRVERQWYLRSLPRQRDRARVLLTPSPEDFALVPNLPRMLWPLLRPVRLVVKYLRRGW